MSDLMVSRLPSLAKLESVLKRVRQVLPLDSLGRTIWIGSIIFLISFSSLVYGYAAHRYRLFPYETFQTLYELFQNLEQTGDPFMPALHSVSIADNINHGITKFDTDKAMPGMNFMSGTFAGGLAIKVTDMQGNVIHEWPISWRKLWPNPDHLEERLRPQGDLNTNVHGAVLLEDGSIVFNFEKLGLIKLDKCGDVVWRLPYRTHHSVFLGEDGLFWVSGARFNKEKSSEFPNIRPPFREATVIAVSQNGEILKEISLLHVLAKNKYFGLLYSHSQRNVETAETGDILHLNDVELFPSALAELSTPFSPGDILVSVRNINAIFVFDPETLDIVWLENGEFLRQHDPDFRSDGNISLLDNNNQGDVRGPYQSRIITFDFEKNAWEITHEGTPESPFYTTIMGKHQWLKNGNLLITESRSARAFEINTDGEVVWEFINGIEPGKGGLLMQVDRYDRTYAQAFEDLSNCTIQ